MALGLYCFSPTVLKACVAPTRRYSPHWGSMEASTPASGVAHAMQGPTAQMRPRIVLLTAAFGLAAAAHIAALPVVA